MEGAVQHPVLGDLPHSLVDQWVVEANRRRSRSDSLNSAWLSKLLVSRLKRGSRSIPQPQPAQGRFVQVAVHRPPAGSSKGAGGEASITA